MVNSENNINHGGWKNRHDKILIVVVPKKVMVASGRDKRDKQNASTSNRYNDTSNHNDADGYIMIGERLRSYPVVSNIGMSVRY